MVKAFIKNNFIVIFITEMVSPLLSTLWGRRVSWGALGIFVVLNVMTVLNMVTTWHSDYSLTNVIPSTTHQYSGNDHTMQLIAEIPNQHLFGASGGDDDLPITSLQLHLVGVIKSDQDNMSHVIISEGNHPGKVYNIGDSLASGIVVNSIANDGVVLESAGRLEKLPLQRSQLNFQGPPQPLMELENN